MSEFSESVHLRTENPYDAVDLLKRARVAGYVFPAHRGWVSFVHAQGAARVGDPDNRARLEEANRGVLLFYDYAADHGCWVQINEGNKPVGRFKASFEKPSARFDRGAFERLGLVSSAGANEIEQWMKRAHIFHERSSTNAYVIAERLGLPRYKWFSYRSELDAENVDPERIEVSADGKVKAPPPKVAPHVALPTPTKPKTKTKTATKSKAKARIKAGSKARPTAKTKASPKKAAKPEKKTSSPKKAPSPKKAAKPKK